MGIEPTSSAWKAEVLPLNYTRNLVKKSPDHLYSTAPWPSDARGSSTLNDHKNRRRRLISRRHWTLLRHFVFIFWSFALF